MRAIGSSAHLRRAIAGLSPSQQAELLRMAWFILHASRLEAEAQIGVLDRRDRQRLQAVGSALRKYARRWQHVRDLDDRQ